MNIRSLKIFALVCIVTFTFGCDSGGDGPMRIECGGTAQFPCPQTMYCDLGKSCGGIDKLGTCRPLPTDCPNEQDPVCGCDSTEYANACYANGARATVAYPGKCIKR